MPSGIYTVTRGIVSRIFPQAYPDTTEASSRLWHDQSVAVTSVVPDFKAMADEGTYFTAATTASYITNKVLGNIATALTDVTPTLLIINGNAVGGSGAPNRRVYLDRVTLAMAVIPATNTDIQYAWKIDSATRYTSGGTALNTPTNVNMDSGNKSAVTAYCGVLVAVAASANARVVNSGVIRGTGTAPVGAIGDTYHWKCGSVDPAPALAPYPLTVALPGVFLLPTPPIILGPQHSAALYVWGTLMASTAPQWYAEIAYGER